MSLSVTLATIVFAQACLRRVRAAVPRVDPAWFPGRCALRAGGGLADGRLSRFLFFLVVQGRMVSGLTAGAVKG